MDIDFNLSSKIVLDRVPQKFYRPENEFEQSTITRFEKIPTDIFESSVVCYTEVAKYIAKEIENHRHNHAKYVIGLSGADSLHPVYNELVKFHKKEGLSFSNVVIFNVDEYYPLQSESNGTFGQLKRLLIDHVDIPAENVFSPDGMINKTKIFEHCKKYEDLILQQGGLDLILLGLDRTGNVAGNSRGSSINSQTRLILLDSETRRDSIGLFGNFENVPTGVITMGLSTIMKSKEIILVACGEDQSENIFNIVEKNMSDQYAASCLQNHHNAKIYADLNAAFELTRINRPWLVTRCDWDDKLIRRAIVWLCQKIGKPILKLTNKDYQDNGLEDLLTKYGSAYNVNIKIFNDLQHTITGWPGGKPNADDTNRPERANPYPKKVLIFSPHPDDDMISMGGTFKRLVDQKQNVFVAYETSGNIAVGDEEVVRYVSFLENMREKYEPENLELKVTYEDLLKFLKEEKKEGDVDTRDILYIKGRIRRQEALAADNYIGVPKSHVNFLDLPFYETGRIKKNPLSEVDVKKVMDFLQTIQPDEMFVAGDLADPHGTHKVCLDAVLAALEQLKNEEWVKNCYIWMYRGAWAEWEIDHIEMTVPLSPEELRAKRNAILRHQSQMESAPFLGNDERLFWQRSEDRNKATAGIYRQLGFPDYEAMEAFVKYKMH